MKPYQIAVPAGLLAIFGLGPATDAARDAYNAFFQGNQRRIEEVVEVPKNRGLDSLVGTANAQTKRTISIEEFYKEAKPADEIMPGLRVQDFGYANIRWNPSLAFYGKNWMDAYNDPTIGQEIRNIFRSLDNTTINFDGISFTFSYSKFQEHWDNLNSIPKGVDFPNDKFMTWDVPEKRKIYVLPINEKIAKEIGILSKSYKVPTI